jgi:ATP-dependent DNA helicase RecG
MKENSHVEFKSSFTDAVIETLVAFANVKGGKVLIGVDDKGQPTNGFIIGSETLQNWVNEIKLKTQPSIIADANVIRIKDVAVVEIVIREFPVKPVSFRGRYFKRVNNANHQLSAIEIADLSLQSLQVSWDSYQVHGKTIDELDFKKVEKFIERVNATGRFQLKGSILQSLEKLKLIKGKIITNAAWLLFAKESIGYNVHLGRFKDPSLIIDDKMYNDSLFEVMEETMRYIVSQIKVAFEVQGMPTKRTEIFEYPLPALRELVLNALVHRDYLSPVDIQIKIFDDKITFFNPGSLFGNLTLEDLKQDNYQAYARNKLIAEAFYLTGDIEKYGSGFLRVRKELASYPTMKLKFDEIPNGFLISLNYSSQKISILESNGGINDGINGGINGGINELLELIYANPGNRAPFFVKKLQVSARTIERWLKILQSQNKVAYQGAKKTGGYWHIADQ